MAVDQKERADAYYCNMVAMLWAARASHAALVERGEADSLNAAAVRDRMRGIVNTIRQIEAGDYHTSCEACGKPLIDGQMVVYYDDAGHIHANCDNPSEPCTDLPCSPYDSGFSPEQCEAEIAKAEALLNGGEG